MDLMQTAQLEGFDTKITGSTNDYSKTAGTDVVVITSGIPRKPGMTREELIGINAGIVKGVSQNILQHSPDAIIIVISNPMDTMTYLALQSTGISKHKIIGMGGILDSARFRYNLSKALNCSPNDIQANVIGGHGDTTMIPLTRLATYMGLPVSHFADEATLAKVAADTMVGGATLTGLLGTSAWYAPGAAGAMLVQTILRNERRMIDLAVKIWRDFASKLERELIATRERAEKAEAELAALRERLASWDALERMADNARELGLDYDEPVKEKNT